MTSSWANILYPAHAKTDLSKLCGGGVVTFIFSQKSILSAGASFHHFLISNENHVILGHPHGDRSPDHQCLPGVSLPTCPRGGAGTA